MTAPTTAQWLRQAAHRVTDGSGRLATHLTARTLHQARTLWQHTTGWLRQGKGLGWLLRLAVLLAAAVILRKILLTVAAGLYARLASGSASWLLWGTATVWVVAAYRYGRDDWEPPTAPGTPADNEAPADEQQPEPGAAVEQTPAGPPAVTPAELAAAVHAIGTPHAQLKPLADHLGTTTDEVRAAAAGMGWPVKDVRMKGRSSAAGLSGDQAPPLPPGTPLPGVVGAGQRADDNDDDTSGEGPGEGVRVVRTDAGLTVYDLADTHRRRGTVTA